MVVQMVQLGLRKSSLPIIGRLPRNIHAGPGIKVQQVLNRDNDDTTAGAVGRPNEIPGDIVTAYSKITPPWCCTLGFNLAYHPLVVSLSCVPG